MIEVYMYVSILDCPLPGRTLSSGDREAEVMQEKISEGGENDRPKKQKLEEEDAVSVSPATELAEPAKRSEASTSSSVALSGLAAYSSSEESDSD